MPNVVVFYTSVKLNINLLRSRLHEDEKANILTSINTTLGITPFRINMIYYTKSFGFIGRHEMVTV